MLLKIAGAFFLFLGINFGLTYFIVFTNKGNDIVKPYVQDYIDAKFDQNVTVEKFVLNTKQVLLICDIGKDSVIKVGGDLNVFSKKVNLKYALKLQDVTYNDTPLKGKTAINGRINGTLKDMLVNGEGLFCNGMLKFDSNVYKKTPYALNATVEKMFLSDALVFLGYPLRTVSGFVNLDLKNVSLIKGKFDGIINAQTVDSTYTVKNYAVAFDSHINAQLQDDMIAVTSHTSSGLGEEKTFEGVYDGHTKIFTSQYEVDFKDLTPVGYHGAFHSLGKLTLQEGALHLEGLSELFDGNVAYTLHDDMLNIKAIGISHNKLQTMLYGSSFLNANGDIQASYNIDTQKGEVLASIKEIDFTKSVLSDSIRGLSGVNISSEKYGDIILEGNIEKNILSTHIDIKSQKTAFRVENRLTYDMDQGNINANIKATARKQDFNLVIQGITPDIIVSSDNAEAIFKAQRGLIKKSIKSQFTKKKKKVLTPLETELKKVF